MGTNFYAVENGEEHWNGTHLVKTSAGWRPPLKWNPDKYRGWDGFVSFVMDPGTTIKDEYGRTWSKRLFVERLERWEQENARSHSDMRHFVTEMDGYEWLRGDWC